MSQQWNFEQDTRQQWHWKRIEDKAESDESFATVTECMLDAVKCAVQRRRAQVDLARKNLLQ